MLGKDLLHCLRNALKEEEEDDDDDDDSDGNGDMAVTVRWQQSQS